MIDGLFAHPLLIVWLVAALLSWLVLFSASKASGAG
jgi:hypothetical protein